MYRARTIFRPARQSARIVQNANKLTVANFCCRTVAFNRLHPLTRLSAVQPKNYLHISASLRNEYEVAGPAFAESISEGDIRWQKKEGDSVSADELVAEIETDKTSVEVNAPESGTIVKLLVGDGDTVTAKQKLYVLKPGAGGSGGAAAKSEEKPKEETPKKEEKKEEPNKEEPKKQESKQDVSGPAPTKAPEQKPQPSKPMSSTPSSSVKPQSYQGDTGAQQPQFPEGRTSTVHIPAGVKAEHAVTGDRADTRIKMNRMRQRIAHRLKEAQNTYAMLTTFNEIDMSNCVALRNKYKDGFVKKHGVKFGFMSPFIKATAHALQDQPIVNAVIENDEMIYRHYVDISVAVASPKGLVVPVLRNVESMNYAHIEKELGRLGALARDNKLAVEDMEGGTFTISNGGVFGSMFGTPIINPPQSAILGMHGIFDRPVAISGKVEIRPMMYVCLTYDHRLIDGREAVTFLKKIKQSVEDPASMFLEV